MKDILNVGNSQSLNIPTVWHRTYVGAEAFLDIRFICKFWSTSYRSSWIQIRIHKLNQRGSMRIRIQNRYWLILKVKNKWCIDFIFNGRKHCLLLLYRISPSRFQGHKDSGSASKCFNPKKLFLSSPKNDLGDPGSGFFPIPDPGPMILNKILME